MTITIKLILIGNTDAPAFTVQDFDRDILLILKRRPYLNYVREKVGATVTYTRIDNEGKLGHVAISPGTDLSPQVQLEICSYIADVAIVASWSLFHSCPHSFKIVDERDASFRNFCRWIFVEFIMKHGLDVAGRPTKVWEHLPREVAAGSSSGKIMIVRPGNFPKKPQTIAWHRQVYQLCAELQAEYRERWEKGDTDDCQPRPGDYRDFVIEQTGKSLSTRRISTILKWGDAGLYEPFPKA